MSQTMEESPFRKDVLEGKVVLVTGGGSGIGLEISRQLGFHGASVAIMGRRKDVLDEAVSVMRAQGVKATSVVGDVRDITACQNAVMNTLRAFNGHLDILINCAAGNFLARAEDLTPKGFKAVMDIDAVGTFNMSRSSFPHLKVTKGCIINISANLHYGATWFQAHASAAKAAIDSLTRSMALEWGNDGVRVNAVAPGPISGTAGLSKLAPGLASKASEQIKKLVPLARLGEKIEIAMACIYLASSASLYVSGNVLVVDGAQWLYREPLVPPALVAKMSKQLEQSTRNIGRATSKL